MSIISSSGSGDPSLPATAGVLRTLRVKLSRNIPPKKSSEENCLMCIKIFSNKYFLERHNRKWHNGNIDDPSVSVNVGINSSSPNNITSVQSSNEVNANIPAARVKRVLKVTRRPCSICEKSFADNKCLRYHMNAYHPSIDFDSICPKRFKTASNCPGQLPVTFAIIILYICANDIQYFFKKVEHRLIYINHNVK